MSRLVTFTLYDATVTPLTGVVPTFVKYVSKTGETLTAPAIGEIGGGKYGFFASDADVEAGLVWLIDGGDLAIPRYLVGTAYEPGAPFEALLFTDVVGDLFADVGAPVFTLYADGAGSARTPPDLTALADNYLWAFIPSVDDLLEGVGWIVQAPADALPTYYDDTAESDEAVVPGGGGVSVFGLSADFVRRHYYPQMPQFSGDSNPTEATVVEKIEDAASDLEAALSSESITASAIIDTTSAAYLWCRKTMALMVAIELYGVMTGQDPKVVEAWRRLLAARMSSLAEDGALALGGGVSVPIEQPDGPTHHITNLGLDTSRVRASASSIDMPFHKDDNT